MNNKLNELKDKVQNIEISYDYEQTYCDLLNTVNDYQNETQDWCFEYLFDEYVDEEILKEMVKYKIDEEGLWSVINLLSGIENYNGVYRIDVYGYGHDIDKEDLELLKENILDLIDSKLEEK